MEQVEQLNSRLLATTHEYPDPDYAAYVTKYPWARDDDDYIPSGLQRSPRRAYRDGLEGNLDSALSQVHDDTIDALNSQYLGTDEDMTIDPDYQASDNVVT